MLFVMLFDDFRYHKLLTPLSKDVDIWSTEYLQQLPHGGTAKQVHLVQEALGALCVMRSGVSGVGIYLKIKCEEYM